MCLLCGHIMFGVQESKYTNFFDDANLGFQHGMPGKKEASFEELPLSVFPVDISVGHFFDY